jgi:DNA replication and repair protein RecF
MSDGVVLRHGCTILRRLALSDFRNLTHVAFEPAPRLNLIHGDNGHGKTSLIEALYVLATTRSFRSTKLLETVREGTEQARLKAEVESFGLRRELQATLGLRGRSFLIDGKKPQRIIDYALKTPVIAFHPGDLQLVSGPASCRRTLLDRVLLYLDPQGADARLYYQKALRDRQKLISESGSQARGSQAAHLDAIEQVVARHGARFARGRKEAAERVIEALGPAFQQMAAPGLRCVTTYEPGGVTDKDTFAEKLLERRSKDFFRGAATFGPQRDELHLSIEGRVARSHASQGQQRLLTLALKMAELSCVREVTGMEPMLLLDDVSSELDHERTTAVFNFLKEARNQIFVTTTRPELFSNVTLEDSLRADFRVLNGHLSKSTK